MKGLKKGEESKVMVVNEESKTEQNPVPIYS